MWTFEQIDSMFRAIVSNAIVNCGGKADAIEVDIAVQEIEQIAGSNPGVILPVKQGGDEAPTPERQLYAALVQLCAAQGVKLSANLIDEVQIPLANNGGMAVSLELLTAKQPA